MLAAWAAAQQEFADLAPCSARGGLLYLVTSQTLAASTFLCLLDTGGQRAAGCGAAAGGSRHDGRPGAGAPRPPGDSTLQVSYNFQSSCEFQSVLIVTMGDLVQAPLRPPGTTLLETQHLIVGFPLWILIYSLAQWAKSGVNTPRTTAPSTNVSQLLLRAPLPRPVPCKEAAERHRLILHCTRHRQQLTRMLPAIAKLPHCQF